ncbi:eukaryotic translation initiation factor 4E (IF4E) [Vairimorpha necatrix]|uniref:Eukaryotic translation initiation factor 4E (IF4E) n=1 Tax=Vairimorpha necatrix TaxID=6039 RepID=A0AAX4JDG8_9MICR
MKLQSKWVIWQNLSEDSDVKTWAEDLRSVGEFSQVEEFKYLEKELLTRKIDKLLSLKIFKYGIKPMWEDPRNMNGGRLVIDIPSASGYSPEEIYILTVAFCISNTAQGICGVVIMSKHESHKISLWIEDEHYQTDVESKWSEVLFRYDLTIYFLLHKKSIDGNKGKKIWNRKKVNY